jgi:capsule biosynthesis phosphatase
MCKNQILTDTQMKRLVLDLDGTLTYDEPSVAYEDKRPRLDVINRVREYKEVGFTIIIATARNMNSFQNSVGLINTNTLPVVIDWLKRYDVPFDEIYVGKPWCGHEGFYVDDKAIRPDELINLTLNEIRFLTKCITPGEPQ